MPWNTFQHPWEISVEQYQLAIVRKEKRQLTFKLFTPDSQPAFATCIMPTIRAPRICSLPCNIGSSCGQISRNKIYPPLAMSRRSSGTSRWPINWGLKTTPCSSKLRDKRLKNSCFGQHMRLVYHIHQSTQ